MGDISTISSFICISWQNPAGTPRGIHVFYWWQSGELVAPPNIHVFSTWYWWRGYLRCKTRGLYVVWRWSLTTWKTGGTFDVKRRGNFVDTQQAHLPPNIHVFSTWYWWRGYLRCKTRGLYVVWRWSLTTWKTGGTFDVKRRGNFVDTQQAHLPPNIHVFSTWYWWRGYLRCKTRGLYVVWRWSLTTWKTGGTFDVKRRGNFVDTQQAHLPPNIHVFSTWYWWRGYLRCKTRGLYVVWRWSLTTWKTGGTFDVKRRGNFVDTQQAHLPPNIHVFSTWYWWRGYLRCKTRGLYVVWRWSLTTWKTGGTFDVKRRGNFVDTQQAHLPPNIHVFSTWYWWRGYLRCKTRGLYVVWRWSLTTWKTGGTFDVKRRGNFVDTQQAHLPPNIHVFSTWYWWRGYLRCKTRGLYVVWRWSLTTWKTGGTFDVKRRGNFVDTQQAHLPPNIHVFSTWYWWRGYLRCKTRGLYVVWRWSLTTWKTGGTFDVKRRGNFVDTQQAHLPPNIHVFSTWYWWRGYLRCKTRGLYVVWRWSLTTWKTGGTFDVKRRGNFVDTQQAHLPPNIHVFSTWYWWRGYLRCKTRGFYMVWRWSLTTWKTGRIFHVKRRGKFVTQYFESGSFVINVSLNFYYEKHKLRT